LFKVSKITYVNLAVLAEFVRNIHLLLFLLYCQLTVLALLGATQFSAKIGPKSRSSRNQEQLKTGCGIAGSHSKQVENSLQLHMG
jgi:hypothetical protein